MNRIIYFFLACIVNCLIVQNFSIAMEGENFKDGSKLPQHPKSEHVNKKPRLKSYISDGSLEESLGEKSLGSDPVLNKTASTIPPRDNKANPRKRSHPIPSNYSSLKKYLTDAGNSTLKEEDKREVLEKARQATLRNLEDEGLLPEKVSDYEE